MNFDGLNKIIDVPANVSDINVASDLYSRWKDWVLEGNAHFSHAFEVSGGDDLGGGKSSPTFFFLLNGWKVRMPIGTGIVTVGYNLFSRDLSNPYISGNTRKQVIAETNTGVIVNTGGGSGAGATPAEIWNYQNRSLTESAGLSQEEHIHLMGLTNASGGGFVRNVGLDAQDKKYLKETHEQVGEIKKQIPDILSQLESIEIPLPDNSEVIKAIEKSEVEICSDIVRSTKELREDNVTTRNLVRQKTKKINEKIEREIEQEVKTQKMIESESEEIEKIIEQNIDFEANEIERQIQDQIESEINEIESNLL